ncbi:LOW QUALITY PROTEIN: FHF complex subunit HOOK-interacting protein 1B [Numenius arquata]|uniref:LOW QUALITY PROTEIN: FHF complex subunit HOOK-interacting protein 1B n=1 Tax=Numenius arquata TaxID=31919 RepID=UPI003D309DB2
MERMSWLSKLNPRGGGQRAPRSASLQSPPVTADPETCLMVFKNHWSQVLRILERGGGCKAAPDDLSAVRNNTYQMLNLLAEDRPRGEAAAPGPILDFVASENLLERLLSWHLQGDFGEERKVEQLKLYEMLISQARQPLLRHKPVLTPLLRLLSLCAEPTSAPLENSLVLLLNQLCVSVAKEPAVLELFFHSPADQGPANLIIFSLLIPFIHHEGVLGQQARDALLLIMAMSASNHAVAKSITDNSYFCPVLATGLSALYSSLPRKLEARGDDWHCLRREDWMGVSSLVLFMNSLEFCNAVIQVAHPLVQKQLVDYVHNGFLVPVMGPALHKSSVEEMIASTAYLELFLRSVSETALLKTFLRFLLLHRHDSTTILDTLVGRINSNSRLCMVSLSLFRTLLSLNCEDVMLQLVLRYLLPCSHVMLSQKRAVRDLDIYGKTAAKFLSLIPRCCRPENLPPPEREEEHAAWSKGHGSPSVDTSSVVTVPKPSTPSRLSFFMRQANPAAEGGASPTPRSPGTPAGSPRAPRPGRWEEVSELEGNYLEYLRDARRSIDRCAWACRVWSAPYDGEDPHPNAPDPPRLRSAPCQGEDPHPGAPRPPTPRTKKRGLPEEGAREGSPGSGGGEEGPGGHRPPSPETRDSGTLVNGAHGPGEPEGGGHDVAVKKVRRSPQGEGDGAGGSPEQNGAATPPPPVLRPQPPPGWEPLPSVDSLIEELLARAPGEPNGAGVTIEAFTEELREIEAEMKNGGGSPPAPPDPSEPPLSREEEEAFASFAALPEGGDGAGRAQPRPPDPLAQLVASPPRAVGPPPSQPFTGPFVSVLFGKLENMLHNSLYVNFLLTGLVAQLACYPQPLLRSFLLNTNMVFQPSVKSLLQVLGSVKNKIESFAAGQQDFPTLLFKAKKYLIARGKLDWAEPPGSVPTLRRPDTLARSRRPSLGELLLRHTNSPTRGRGAAPAALRDREGPGLQGMGGGGVLGGGPPPRPPAERQSQALRVKNAVYCAVIFSEFLKELAAIAQAHAVTSPFLTEPPEE